MASRKVEDYAYKYGLSNREAKKRLGRHSSVGKYTLPVRGMAIAGTGKGGPKRKKGKKG